MASGVDFPAQPPAETRGWLLRMASGVDLPAQPLSWQHRCRVLQSDVVVCCRRLVAQNALWDRFVCPTPSNYPRVITSEQLPPCPGFCWLFFVGMLICILRDYSFASSRSHGTFLRCRSGLPNLTLLGLWWGRCSRWRCHRGDGP